MHKSASSGFSEKNSEYLYKTTDIKDDEIINKRLESYFFDLETDFNSYVQDFPETKIVDKLLSEIHKKFEIKLDVENTNEYLREFINYRKERKKGNRKNYELVEKHLSQINDHLCDEMDKNKLDIFQVPKNKKELEELIEKDISFMVKDRLETNADMNMTERICRSRSKNDRPRIFSGNKSFITKNDSVLGGINNISDTNITLDNTNLQPLKGPKNIYRTAANDNNNSFSKIYSPGDAQQFVREMQKDKQEFLNRMTRLKEQELSKRQEKDDMRKTMRVNQREAHSIEAQHKLDSTMEELKKREQDRESSRVQYQEHLRSRKKFTFQVIQDRYHDLKQSRREEDERILQTIHERQAPNKLDGHFKEHMRKYRVSLEVQEIRRKEKTSEILSEIKVHEQQMGLTASMKKQYEVDKVDLTQSKFFAANKKRDAVLAYGKQIKSEFFPKIQSYKTQKPLPIELYENKKHKLRQNLSDFDRHKKLVSLGNQYLETAKKRAKKLEGNRNRFEDVRFSDNSMSPVPKIVKPPNYLKELRKSKILNKNVKSWDKIASNPDFNTRDKYECLVSEVEKQDAINDRHEKKLRCGVRDYADNINSSSQGPLVDSIKAKIALLQEL